LSAYTGVYGGYLYGNMTVFHDEGENKLYMKYGRNGHFELLPQEEENTFFSVPLNNNPYNFGRIVFHESTSGAGFDQMKIPVGMPDDPNALLIRDLDIYDLPPPPSLEC